jgi:hypothetical protein
VDEERERTIGAQDEEDVEAHKVAPRMDEDAASDPARRENDDESDVEAHSVRPNIKP